VGELKNIISPEIKGEGNYLYLAEHQATASGLPNYDLLNKTYADIHQHIKNSTILSAQTIKDGGLASAVFKMAVGNGIGADINYGKDCFIPQIGSLILESKTELAGYELLGKTGGSDLTINSEIFNLAELTAAWEGTLEPIFPSVTPRLQPWESTDGNQTVRVSTNEESSSAIIREDIPRVFIPIFPGTNCEYESEHVFVDAGADVHTRLFANYSEEAISESIAAFVEQINAANIMMIPGGFSAGDEPDGSAKYIVSVLKNPAIKDAVHALLKRGGLMLGICNGFQALVKSGLLPYGEIRDLDDTSATMTFNSIGRHISQTAHVEVKSDKSPWLAGMKGKKYIVPFSHGEGRFYADDAMVKELAANGQIATQYIDFEGNIALDMPYNPNGSVHGIEGITDATGQIYGRMGHPERYRKGLMKNIPEMEFMDIFKNGVEWFKG
jgi:phosphoribosylformylglycinamidine synthase